MLNHAQMPAATLRRYADRWVDHALRHAPRRHPATPRQVHQLRVSIKRLRTLWRLLAPLSDKVRRRKQNVALRDAARSVSMARDAHVARKTLRSLASSDARHAADLRRLAERIELPDEKPLRVPPRLIVILNAARTALHAATAGVESWKQVNKAFGRLHRRARKARARAKRHRHEAGAYHEWRKHCKDVLYAIDMLAPKERQKQRKLRDLLRQCNALLGHDHDLVVLRTLLSESGSVTDTRTAARAVRLIDKRLVRMRKQTIKLTRKM